MVFFTQFSPLYYNENDGTPLSEEEIEKAFHMMWYVQSGRKAQRDKELEEQSEIAKKNDTFYRYRALLVYYIFTGMILYFIVVLFVFIAEYLMRFCTLCVKLVKK